MVSHAEGVGKKHMFASSGAGVWILQKTACSGEEMGTTDLVDTFAIAKLSFQVSPLLFK